MAEMNWKRARSENAAPLRHCMVVYAYYPLAETRVQRQAEALVGAGFEVDVICPRQPDESRTDLHGEVKIRRLPLRIRKANLIDQLVGYVLFLVAAAWVVSGTHLKRRYHSIQVHNLPDFLVFCAAIPRLMGVPVILDLHDLMPEFFAGRFPDAPRALARLVGWQERVSCRFADLVITVSDPWKDALVERGVEPGKIAVVMNVADDRIFRRPAARQSSGRRFRLIYHGSVHQRYGLDLAVEAVSRLAHEIPGLHLTILGRGDAMEELRQLTRELGVLRLVELRDEFVHAEELPGIIACADLGIVPYRNDIFTDGLLPTKLMEYAEMGLPCVASATTGIETYFGGTMVELFTPGDVGSLADAILELYRDPHRRAKLADQATLFTDRYNWRTIGAEYVGHVKTLASQDPAAA